MRLLDFLCLASLLAPVCQGQSSASSGPFGDVSVLHGRLPADAEWTLWVAYGRGVSIPEEEERYNRMADARGP